MAMLGNEALSSDSSDELKQIIDFVLNLVKSEKDFNDFSIDDTDRFHLESFIFYHAPHPVKDKKQALTTVEFSNNVLSTLQYLKETSVYKTFKKKVDREHLPDILEANNIPKEIITPLYNDAKPIEMEPKDCRSLKDWPEHRLPANGHSGRKENAGQFIRRLFEQKLYTEKKFGKLYLSDLRTINHKLYQALVQWQKRYPGESLDMLGNQHEKVEARLEKHKRGELADNYIERSRAHITNSRNKQAAP